MMPATRAVSVGVGRIAGVAEEVVAVHVVDEAVAVVIEAVARDLTGVGPEVRGQVGVGELDAGVDDADHHAGAARRHVPCRRGADLRQSPLRGVRRVVRDRVEGEHPVRLCVLDRRIVLQRGHGLFDVVFLQFEQVHAIESACVGMLLRRSLQLEPAEQPARGFRAVHGGIRRVAGLVLHDHLACPPAVFRFLGFRGSRQRQS
jgi:hypothetical protein